MSVSWKNAIWVLGLLFCYAAGALAQTASELMEEANKAYQQRDFAKAERLYEHLLEAGYTSTSALYFNLGNACYEQQKIGRAVWMYERALQLRPGNQAARHNLALAQQQVREWIEPEPVFFLTAWWRQLRQQLSANGWSFLALLLVWLALGAWLAYLFAPQRRQRKWGFLLGVLLPVLAVLPLSLSWSARQALVQPGAAIVLDSGTVLYSAPDTGSQNILPLSEGIRIRLIDGLSNWHKVRLGNGTEGWVEAGKVGVL